MRIGLIVSGNKYTGAAAVAEHRCRALTRAGVTTRLLYVAGNNLEERLRDQPWAEPGLRKERTPADLRSNLGAVRDLGWWADIVVSHLPHDHALCRVSRTRRNTVLVRSFSNPSHLRRHLYHRWLLRHTSAMITANSSMIRPAQRLAGAEIPVVTVPVPLEDRFCSDAYGGEERENFGIPETTPVLGMVGKVSPGRGFEELLETASMLDASWRVLIVGHGEARQSLEVRAEQLRIGGRVIWAGYQEERLPQLLAAMDFVLLAAPGSDHGHRVITEAQGCGRPVIAFDIPGVRDLVSDAETGRVVPDARGAAKALSELIRNPMSVRNISERAARATDARRFGPCGRQLAGFLEPLLPRPPLGGSTESPERRVRRR